MGQTPTKERKVPQGGLVFQLTRTDPDYKTKRQILVAVLKPVIARLDPSEWVSQSVIRVQSFSNGCPI
jgi:hypothetical protein